MTKKTNTGKRVGKTIRKNSAVRRTAPARIPLDAPVVSAEEKPTISFIKHFVKSEEPIVSKSKYDYLSLYNKVRKIPFSVPTSVSLLIDGSYTDSIKKSALSMLKYFIDMDVFKPHSLEFSGDFERVRVSCDINYSGSCIRDSWRFVEHKFKSKIQL
jgi:hypothetical protein